jgi:predicted SprT family Zn-dependent metalloprotease
MTQQSDEEKLAALKKEMFDAIRVAEKASYAYFCACEVGPERIRAHDVYSNILYSTRVR